MGYEIERITKYEKQITLYENFKYREGNKNDTNQLIFKCIIILTEFMCFKIFFD